MLRWGWLIVLVAGCEGASTSPNANTPASPGTNASAGPLKIVTTCGMVTDIVRQVAGDVGTVDGLLGEGVDPHLYKPTRNDVKQLTGADVIFYSGLLLEGRMSDTFTQIARQGRPVYAVTESLDPEKLREPPEFEGHYDPHVWMDVALWSECVERVAKALAELRPPQADAIRTRTAAYRAELARLDDFARTTLATVPDEQRVLVTAHDAFGYFARAYGLSVRSVQGLTTESEAGTKDVADLVDFIVARKIGAIFVESTINPKTIQAVIEGAGQKKWKVVIGGELFSDAMGAPGTYEGTYIGMMDHNITTIARALGGTAPERGLNGKLAVPQAR